jgi:predicted O-methyltransferase YrrM
MAKLIITINYFYLFKTIIRIFLYLFSNTKRYSNLLFYILLHRPKSILEIGVYDGRRALQMIEAAKIFNNRINYYGFDLFEDFSKFSNILDKELSKKPKNQFVIKNNLRRIANVILYKGFTKKTLKNFTKNNSAKIDFVFIDG